MILLVGQQRRHKKQNFGHSGVGEGGMLWESIIGMYTLSYAKYIARGNSLYDTGNPKPVLCDNLEGWDCREGTYGQFIWCMAETITIL